MTESLDAKLQSIFADVFGLEAGDYRPDLSSERVSGWDSVLHLTLLLTLEQKFGVAFDPEVGARLTSVPAIKQALAEAGISE